MIIDYIYHEEISWLNSFAFKFIETIYSIMQQVLSLPSLLTCLTEKDRYKGTQLYLNEIQQFNEEIYALIDQAFQQTLLGSKTTPMARLLSLRFFKEIMMSANFTLIDGIDEKVEEHIIHVAQYNKKSKEVNRGANYFSDTLKIKNDAEMQKIGSSYVLLALEIIQMFGKWYKIDEDGEETRFYQYYNELMKSGVVFPSQNQLNFFKKDDEEKFRKNYKRWTQRILQITDIKKQQQVVEKEKPSQMPPPLLQKNVNFSVQESIDKSKVAPIKEPEKTATLNIVPSILSDQAQLAKISQIKAQLAKKDEQILKIQTLLKNSQNKTAQLQKTIQGKDAQLLKIQEQLKSVKLANEKAQQKGLTLVEQCYQILVSPPKNTDDLIEQIDILEDMVKQSTEGFEKYKQDTSKELNNLRDQNQKLKKTLEVLSVEVQRRKKQNEEDKLMQQQRQIEERVLRQSQCESFRVQDQPKQGSKQMQEKQLILIKEQILTSKKEVLKDKSNLNKMLRNQLTDICEEKSEESNFKQTRQVSRSLKKTESQHRLKSNLTSMTTSNFRKTNTQSKLIKTAQSFKPKDQVSNKIVTVFPYLSEYFPILSSEYRNFKQQCLFQSKEPFYENEWIKVALSRPNESQSCYVYIYNKTGTEQKIKVFANSSNLSLQGEKVKKAPSLTAIQFDLKLGVPDLNMRFPKISVFIGNHKISLTTTSSNEKVFEVLLPITLLDYFKIQKSSPNTLHMPKTIKHGSNKFMMSSNLPNIQQTLPNMVTELHYGDAVRVGSVDCGQSQLRLQIMQNSRELTITTEFSDGCELCKSLSKVFLQILMWLLRD